MPLSCGALKVMALLVAPYIASWGQDVAMSTDSREGVTSWNLVLT